MAAPIVVIRELDHEQARALKAATFQIGPEVMPAAPDGQDGSEGDLSEDRSEEGRFDFGIEREGRLVGLVQTYVPDDRKLPSGTFEIGIVLFDGSDRGHGVGTEALRLFVEWLQREQGANKIQAVTALDNHPMRRSLAKLGFSAGDEVMVGEVLETIFALDLSVA
jgi:RimJ/RimL family protein N-acetyltransferase